LQAVEDATGVPVSVYTPKKEDYIKSLGAYGIAYDRASELWDVLSLSTTGKYTDDFGREKEISKSDQEILQGMAPFSAMSVLGLMPSDVASGVRSAVKFAKGEKSGGPTMKELKERDPELYEENYGKGSDYEMKQERKRKRRTRRRLNKPNIL